MKDGRFDHDPVIKHYGYSDQPWLDAYWGTNSKRLGLSKFANGTFAGCLPGLGLEWDLSAYKGEDVHCLLSSSYDFFADYKSVRNLVFWTQAMAEDPGVAVRPAKPRSQCGLPQDGLASHRDRWFPSAARRIVEWYGLGAGIKLVHYPGEFRKPWFRWTRAVRSRADSWWWAAHDAMCYASPVRCRLRCEAIPQ
mmetsp:Transcript_115256/g.264660  ORF Transcript_115256/g.264660 Transcript_115256/m.264660 type:complete len:194 (+) Transcript_115256:1-582(+)